MEFVVATTWLAEDNHKSRNGANQFLPTHRLFTLLGDLMVAGAYYLAVTYGEALPMVCGGHEAWRYTLLSGLIPALPLLVICPFLPASLPCGERKRQASVSNAPISPSYFNEPFSGLPW